MKNIFLYKLLQSAVLILVVISAFIGETDSAIAGLALYHVMDLSSKEPG